MLAAKGDIAWGNLPSWLALASVVVALAVYRSGRRDSTRSYASRVHLTHVSAQWGQGEPPAGEEYHTTVAVTNGSDAPIFDVEITAFDWGRRRRAWRWRKARDRIWTGEKGPGRVFTMVSPMASSAPQTLPGLEGVRPTEVGSLRPPVVMVFRDGNGRRWIRWPDGRLSPARWVRWLPRG